MIVNYCTSLLCIFGFGPMLNTVLFALEMQHNKFVARWPLRETSNDVHSEEVVELFTVYGS